jgi:hypothetical protein
LEKKTEIVFVCQFCEGSIYFDNKYGLAGHYYSTHKVEAYLELAKQQERKVSKNSRKWNIDFSGSRR